MTKPELKQIILSKESQEILPYMSPDMIDAFVTWLYKAVDLRSFERSPAAYKLQMLRRFINSLPARKRADVTIFTKRNEIQK